VIYAFDDFTVDVGKRELREQGKVVPTEPLLLDLLIYLVANRSRVITK
jgi:DNA-binding winged helix-turn-helix (wHTH) protein